MGPRAGGSIVSDSTSGAGATPHSFGERLVGALRLDSATYDEIEHDSGALGQAAGVVLLGAVATGIGAPGADGAGGLVGGLFGAVIGWALSAAVVWLVGVKLMDHSSDYPELLRTLGFASAPQIAMVVGVVGFLAPLVAFAVALWGLAAYVIAVRQALDVETGRAVLVCLLAFGIKVLAVLLLAMLAGIGGAVGP